MECEQNQETTHQDTTTTAVEEFTYGPWMVVARCWNKNVTSLNKEKRRQNNNQNDGPSRGLNANSAPNGHNANSNKNLGLSKSAQEKKGKKVMVIANNQAPTVNYSILDGKAGFTFQIGGRSHERNFEDKGQKECGRQCRDTLRARGEHIYEAIIVRMYECHV
ncbi:hypothetical protein CCACVL1_24556 [Corchorus capsularis]|uniref:Uncharacterized protein n=1 Tax=Corchorus capsularis TaxID=210143 RepID=A0A1R3GP81_COCAP|nr:hypothetical protein CCACVL1_24556 [Corchorus capsularis]